VSFALTFNQAWNRQRCTTVSGQCVPRAWSIPFRHHIFGGAGNETNSWPDPNSVNYYGMMNLAG
jgi:hypothetical protein